jgi:spore coat protein B
MIRNQKDSQSVESNAYLKSLVGKRVKVFRGGPESSEGRLLDVQSDYIALLPEQSNNNAKNENTKNDNAKKDNSIIYYNLRHIQSISENLKANSVESNLRHVQSIVQSISENIYSNLRQVQSISENLIANLKHVERIGENSKANSVESSLKLAENVSENSNANSVEWSITYDSHPELVSADNFTALLKKLIGSMIKVNQGGPESKKGILLLVADDYMGLLTEDDGIVFYHTTHVKSVSVQSLSQNIDQSAAGSDSPIHYNYFDDINFDEINAQSFYDLFDYFAYKWVSINRGGPEASEGILVQEEGEHYTLVNKDEVIRIYPYHIKSISIGSKGFLKQQQQQQQNNETNENESDEDEDMTNKAEDDRTSDRDHRDRDYYEIDYRDRDYHDRDHHDRDHRDRDHRDRDHRDRDYHEIDYRDRDHHDRDHRDRDHRDRDHRDRDHRSSERGYTRERIIKTIDYIWDPKR